LLFFTAKAIVVLLLPHFRIYERNTLFPVRSIIKETDPLKAVEAIEKWIKARKVEVSYVQVAVCLIFHFNGCES
jgi:hypothetical protein